MKKNNISFLILLIFLVIKTVSSQVMTHCGYDFTTFLVTKVYDHETNKPIEGLKIYLCNQQGENIINKNNQWSFLKNNQPLVFYSNKLLSNQKDWQFPYAKESYLLSLRKEFQANGIFVKVIDPKGHYIQQIVEVHEFNLYLLCVKENRKKQFAPPMNTPIEVYLTKK